MCCGCAADTVSAAALCTLHDLHVLCAESARLESLILCPHHSQVDLIRVAVCQESLCHTQDGVPRGLQDRKTLEQAAQQDTAAAGSSSRKRQTAAFGGEQQQKQVGIPCDMCVTR